VDIDSIRRMMATSLNNDSIIPPDAKGAFVTVYDGHHLVSTVATNLNGNWELSGSFGFHPGSKKDIVGEVKIRATW
jgi:hypothetical protein